jgi:hypothetical protein
MPDSKIARISLGPLPKALNRCSIWIFHFLRETFDLGPSTFDNFARKLMAKSTAHRQAKEGQWCCPAYVACIACSVGAPG